jgi:hypothetical protein
MRLPKFIHKFSYEKKLHFKNIPIYLEDIIVLEVDSLY